MMKCIFIYRTKRGRDNILLKLYSKMSYVHTVTILLYIALFRHVVKPGEVSVPKATPVRGSESTVVEISWSVPNDLGFNLASDFLYTVKMCILPGLTNCATKKTAALKATMSVSNNEST